MKNIAIVSVLLCALLAFVAADTQSSSITLDVFHGSNNWWLAVAVNNGDVGTKAVQIRESQSSTWADMTHAEGWDYWTYSSGQGQISFPVSLLLTGDDGQQVAVLNVITSASAGEVDAGVQYASGTSAESTTVTESGSTPDNSEDACVPPTAAPTASPTQAPATEAPTAAPSTEASKHTSAPTTQAATTTKAPTTTKAATTTEAATTTKAPTTTKAATTTEAPTTTKAATTTKAPTTTTKPTSGSGCSAGMKLMVPLYSYPGSTWNTVAAGGSSVHTVAIINPNSGPGNGPDSAFVSGMNTLHNAGVEMVGYVHTSYGARAIADVKAEIAIYASEFPLVVGIFLDECSASASEVSYYTELYSYIMSFPGWKYDILNPGAVPASGYTSAATQIVTFEDTSSKFASSSNPSGASCSTKDEYAVITYGATSASAMESVVNTAVSKGYYGWVYATDTSASGNTYGTLPSYYSQMVSYIASVN